MDERLADQLYNIKLLVNSCKSLHSNEETLFVTAFIQRH
jgi:hypothetical protein